MFTTEPLIFLNQNTSSLQCHHRHQGVTINNDTKLISVPFFFTPHSLGATIRVAPRELFIGKSTWPDKFAACHRECETMHTRVLYNKKRLLKYDRTGKTLGTLTRVRLRLV